MQSIQGLVEALTAPGRTTRPRFAAMNVFGRNLYGIAKIESHIVAITTAITA